MGNDEGKSLKIKTFSNLLWRFAERCGAQGVTFVVSIVLARILEPSDYGTIALVTVFTSILQVFVDSGLGNALIQKKDADDLDFSSVFYFNILTCLILYFIAFVSAPFIADFYNNSELTSVFRVLSLTIVISGVKNVQQAYVGRKLIYKRFFFATLGGTIGAAVIGITMALKGFGVWALVCQSVFNTFVDTVILWITVKWRPKLMFSVKRLKSLISYGWKLLASSLINTIYNDLRSLIIGKKYTSADLAYYNKGHSLPYQIVCNINSSIDSVLFPVLAKAQDDMGMIKSITRRAIRVSSFFMWPFMIGLMSVGEPLIHILLTDKWMPCLPYLYIFCFTLGFMPIQTANLNAIKATGHSDTFLKIELIKKLIGFIILLVSMNISVLAIAASMILYTIIDSIIDAIPTKQYADYSYGEQIKDIIPSFTLSAIMGIVVYSIPWDNSNVYYMIVIKILVGIIIYIGGAKVFRIPEFEYCKNLIGNIFKKR